MEPQSQAAPGGNSAGEATTPREEVTEKSWIQKIKDKFLPGVKITLLVSLIFYIAMFIIGIWGIRKCPVNDNIPFFLIITGGIGLISKALTIVRENILKQHPVEHLESSFYTVELVFLLLGSYWVFKVYKPSFYDGAGSNYCNKTVYMFAFIYLATLYAIMITMFLCFCCFLGCIYFVKKTEGNNDDAESQTRPMRESNSETIP